MRKKLLIILLAITTAVTACAFSMSGCGLFGWNKQKEGFEYDYSSDYESYIIKKYYEYKGQSTDLVIPSEYNGKPVTAIGDFVFENCYSFTSVTISDSITSIGIYAFKDCVNLKSITIPSGVISIGGLAFGGCSGLESITVAADNQTFKSENNCLLSKDGKQLFLGCKNSIISDGVTAIEKDAFFGCTELASITLPDSVTSIGHAAFESCSNLTSVTLGKGLTSIGDYAFRYCTNLTNLAIPEGVTQIGDFAFENCIAFTVINLPASVTEIGYSAFEYCRGLESIIVSPDNDTFKSENNCLLSKDGTTLVAGCKNSIIPDGVATIYYYAFSGCNGLTNITIPDGVIKICSGAFSGCSELTAITLPNGVTSIEEHTFYDCIKLKSIIIPEGVTSIDRYAFSDCRALTTVTIPNSVTTIGYDAFVDCTNLTDINFNGTKKQWEALEFERGGLLWVLSIGDYTVHCTDGDIVKDC